MLDLNAPAKEWADALQFLVGKTVRVSHEGGGWVKDSTQIIQQVRAQGQDTIGIYAESSNGVMCFHPDTLTADYVEGTYGQPSERPKLRRRFTVLDSSAGPV